MCVFTCVHMCVCAYGDQKSTLGIIPMVFSTIFDTRSLPGIWGHQWGYQLGHQLSYQEAPGTHCVPLPNTRIITVHNTAFGYLYLETKHSHHVCKASLTWLTYHLNSLNLLFQESLYIIFVKFACSNFINWENTNTFFYLFHYP